MSRGLGVMEREILRILVKDATGHVPGPKWLRVRALYGFTVEPDVFGITSMMMGTSRTFETGYSSFKRAIRSLERKGFIEKHSGSKAAAIRLCVPVEEVHIDLAKQEDPGQRRAR